MAPPARIRKGCVVLCTAPPYGSRSHTTISPLDKYGGGALIIEDQVVGRQRPARTNFRSKGIAQIFLRVAFT